MGLESTKKPYHLYFFLELIRHRPGMYLGELGTPLGCLWDDMQRLWSDLGRPGMTWSGMARSIIRVTCDAFGVTWGAVGMTWGGLGVTWGVLG